MSHVTKNEIREAFAGFGRMTDVFIGLRKGKNGKYYVFIRYVDVKNVREMERKLDGTMVRGRRLEVNVALHKRKEIPGMTKNENQGHNNRRSSAFIPKKSPGGWGFRDQRTFAEVAGRGRNDVHNSPPPPITTLYSPIHNPTK
ncbi:unnamed protein product [Lactuca virosa]|uniref:RRM domain-containing protein n=1 Tax=Lactuca virosa TaxID=75947 RepID=A0AAU9P4N5_9ASTR|nr:unnamed protein product [Lactuca virosa]